MLRVCFIRGVVLAVTLFSVSALADVANSARYLALGDSIPFGYYPTEKPLPTSNYQGYPELLSDTMKLKVANASCFGETSGTFLKVGSGDLCSQWRLTPRPLHVDYDSPTQSQVDYAVKILKLHPDKIKLITLTIGGNDLEAVREKCTTEAGLDAACAFEELPGTLAAYAMNLGKIYAAIRRAGYSGPIVAVTYYAFNYSPTDLFTQALAMLNSVMKDVTAGYGGIVADGFEAFRLESLSSNGDACKAGLLAGRVADTCDTHPSAKGRKSSQQQLKQR